MNKFLKYGPIRFIISQLILCIPLIWKGELQLLLVSEKFYYWLTGTLILSLCIFFKIKIDDTYHKNYLKKLLERYGFKIREKVED